MSAKRKRGKKLSDSERQVVINVKNYLAKLNIQLNEFCRANKIDPKTLPCKLHQLNQETADICAISMNTVINCFKENNENKTNNPVGRKPIQCDS